jgi:rhamnulose-1-phosphate aldolase
MGGKKQSITTQELKDLAARFNVTPLPEALATEKWIS